MIFFKNLFKKKPKKEHLSEDGCPNKCGECGTKALTLRKHLDDDKKLIAKYVSCSVCRKQLATYKDDKWMYP